MVGAGTAPPFRAVASVAPLVAWWQAQAAADPESGLGRLARELVTQAGAAPALLADNPSAAVLATHAGLVDALFTALVAPAARDTAITGALAPVGRQVVYASPLFRRVALTTAGQLNRPINLTDDETTAFLAHHIGQHVTAAEGGGTTAADETLLITVPDRETGLYRHFKVDIDSRFLAVEYPAPRPPTTTGADASAGGPPPDSSPLVRGFLVLHLTDVTPTQVLSSLKNDLLARDVLHSPDRLEQLQEQLRALFRRPSLRLGLIGYTARTQEPETFGQHIGGATLSFGLVGQLLKRRHDAQTLVRQLLESAAPLLVSDAACAPDLPPALAAALHTQHIRSAVLCPLRYGPDSLGILELSDPAPGAFTPASLPLIEQFLPLFAVAVHRHQEADWAQVQAIVKERFTAIHPALEWRFVEAAEDFLAQRRRGAPPRLAPIVFPGVFPLYGAVDVRGSSAWAAQAAQDDLQEQLRLAWAVLAAVPAAAPAELQAHCRKVGATLTATEPPALLEVIRTHFEPLLDPLTAATTGAPGIQAAITAYYAALNPYHGDVVYRHRKAFEEALTDLNQHLSAQLDAADAEAQRILPHYYRRFVTDGVEFDMYAGRALLDLEHRRLLRLSPEPHPLAERLARLRRHQLRTLIAIARATPTLPLNIPLRTTQLLLVQGQPLSISFREEERRFDVSGAADARFEIIKKRLDKATYPGPDGRPARLTQPGAVAIVYQHLREAAEYDGYIAELRAAGLLTNAPTERLELDEAPGVRGLRALRVWVTPADGAS